MCVFSLALPSPTATRKTMMQRMSAWMRRSSSPPPERLVCPSLHDLKPTSFTEPVSCRVCAKEKAKHSAMLFCRACDYAICKTCMKKGAGRGPSSPQDSPTALIEEKGPPENTTQTVGLDIAASMRKNFPEDIAINSYPSRFSSSSSSVLNREFSTSLISHSREGSMDPMHPSPMAKIKNMDLKEGKKGLRKIAHRPSVMLGYSTKRGASKKDKTKKGGRVAVADPWMVKQLQMASLHVFDGYNQRTLKQLVDSFSPLETVPKGEVLITAGAIHRTFYFLHQGTVHFETSVIKEDEDNDNDNDEKDPAEVPAPNPEPRTRVIKSAPVWFGESVCSASGLKASEYTVIAATDLQVRKLTRVQFEWTQKILARRAVVMNVPFQDEDKTARETKEHKKTEQEQRIIIRALKSVIMLRTLEEGQLIKIAEAMQPRDVKKGDTLITQGERSEEFYICADGKFHVWVDGKQVAHKNAGQFFGELALMHSALRSASVTAAKDSKVWQITRLQLRSLLASANSSNETTKLTNLLEKVKMFDLLFPEERKALIPKFSYVKFKPKEIIYKRGQPAQDYFLVDSGDVEEGVLCPPEPGQSEGPFEKLASYLYGFDLGYMELFPENSAGPNENGVTDANPENVCVRRTDCRAGDSITGLYRLPREDFLKVFGDMKETFDSREDNKIGNKEFEEKLAEALKRAEDRARALAKHEEKATSVNTEGCRELVTYKSLDELTVIGTLGRGAFGWVRLVKDEQSRQVYAMKTMNKHLLVETKQLAHVRSERDVMSSLSHPSLINFRGWFQDKNSLHFLIEPCLGGELGSLLEEREYLTEDEARFFTANIAIALRYMHSRGVAYRDLKPENVLLDKSGYIKVADFGFAKVLNSSQSYTLCGTPDYLAPEAISGRGHSYAVDYWSLGVVLYELLVGVPPFSDATPMGIYNKVLNGTQVTFDSEYGISQEAQDLIFGLLNMDPYQRFGIKEIMAHAWYADNVPEGNPGSKAGGGFDWVQLEGRGMEPPVLVSVANDEDIGNFRDYLGEDDRWKDFTLEEGEVDPFDGF
eukprot:g7299.t1